MSDSVSPLLSNPDLDELYSIRRILVGRYNSHHKINDTHSMVYYHKKIHAMDAAIKAFIEVNSVPVEFQEALLLGGQPSSVRIPGEK